MDDIYMLADTTILNRIGNKLKATFITTTNTEINI